jgi:FHA domain
MIDSHSLAEYSSHILTGSSNTELEQRLGLYRVFLKLYEHHRGLLDEILDLENTGIKSRIQASAQYIQGVVQGQQIYLTTNLLRGKTQALSQPENIWLVGRDSKSALSLQDKRLSRSHAAIQYLPNQGFYLIDLNSTNGSFVNGEPVRTTVLLNEGDQIRLGSISFHFYLCTATQAIAPLAADLLQRVQAAHQASATAVSCPAGAIEWNTPLSGSAEDTSMFLLPKPPLV